jgi:hypothetical protein
MHIGLISYHPSTSLADPEVYSDFQGVCQHAVALQQHGFQAHWLSSTDTAEALVADARLVAADVQDVPATCRYVVPYQSYRLAGVSLLCVDRACWHQPDLHTRLFTLLCLLQRERAYTVLHAWGTLPALYMTVYTACFLGIPAVVSYGPLCLAARAQYPFLWQWVAQHAALACVMSDTDRDRLLATSSLTPARVHVVEPLLPTALHTITSLYGGWHSL